jgi:phosphomannomutase
VGLLAAAFLTREPGASIVHDPRIIWNTQDIVTTGGGTAIQARTGHAFLKQALRDTGAVYGGEMSAHHYFRDFMACDSGMIPWLLVASLLSTQNTSLADLLADRRAAFPSSGEINYRLDDAEAAVDRVVAALEPEAQGRDDTDGVGLDFGSWRLNLRRSNTEPLLRLNVEARGDAALVTAGVARVEALIKG